jgi:uncharacterized phage protein (predicted DNA packaging)
MLEEIKRTLRINTSFYDQEILDLIDGAKLDLVISGITAIKANDELDPLIKRAITTYCKANFGWNNPDADRLGQSYSMLKIHLSLCSEYNGGDAVVV